MWQHLNKRTEKKRNNKSTRIQSKEVEQEKKSILQNSADKTFERAQGRWKIIST